MARTRVRAIPKSPVRCNALLGARSVRRPVFRQFDARCFPVPFATTALHGLSDLNVWWLRLGSQHRRIHPGCLQEIGAHERMHRMLKPGAFRPPRANLRA
jgi:hypothetical protein